MLIWREKTRRWWLEEIEKWRWVIAVLCGAVVMMPAHAQSMHSLQALSDGAAASSLHPHVSSTVWINRGGVQSLSGVLLGPNWGITAAHTFDSGTSWTVGNGSNFITDPGMTRTVTSFVPHPLSVPGGFVGNEVDLAVFFLDAPLPGTYPSIGSSVLNELLSYNGFGRPATPGTGNLPVDGQRRLFQTNAEQFGSVPGGISTDYVIGGFYPTGSLGYLPLGGAGTSGGSGSGVYNQSGELVAMLVAGSGSPDYLASTISLRLDLYEPWINTVVPSPGTATLLVMGGMFAVRRRRM